MYKVYPAIINKENDVFWVEFPDLPGCQTMGETIEETMKNAEEALGLFLASFVEDGQEIPEASAIEDIESKYSKKLRVRRCVKIYTQNKGGEENTYDTGVDERGGGKATYQLF